MDAHLARALLSAWQLPQFHDALRHLIDLDEVTGLLAALAAGAPDEQTRQRSLGLLRKASETEDIRQAVLLLIADPGFREQISQVVVKALADRPALGRAVGAAILDPQVAIEVGRVLDSARARAALWKAVDSQLAGRRVRLLTAGLALLAKRDVRRLLWSLHKYGVIRELRRLQSVAPQR
jgi:hypothetical protein